jgi:hypothetical protein
MTNLLLRSAVGRTAVMLGLALAPLSLAPLALGAQSTARLDITQSDSTTAQVTVRARVTATATEPSAVFAPSASIAGPRLAPAALTTTSFATANTPAPTPADDNANMGPNLALMGAGAAGVVVGLLIGGDGGTAIALGGGVVGLIGLYRYLR